MNDIQRELKIAISAVSKANKLKCLCDPLTKLGFEPCTCGKADRIRLALTQLNTVRSKIQEENRKKGT